jgi:hypothetical protein
MRALDPKNAADVAIRTAGIAAAYNASKGLPEAPEGLAESAVFNHAGNPALPYSPADPMDGRPGSISAAYNAILLHCAGFRVPKARIVAILTSHNFEVRGVVQAGKFNPLHSVDLSSKKMPTCGHFAVCVTTTWHACNPEFLAAIGRALPEPTMETAAGLEAAAKALPKTNKPLKPGKAPRGSNKGKGKPDPETLASPADLAAGKALTE